MAENEQRPGAEPEEPPGATESGQGKEEAGKPATPGSPGQTRPHAPAAAGAAAVLLLAAGLFMAGFWTHSLVDGGVDLNPVEEKLVALEYRTGNVEKSLTGLSQAVVELASAPAEQQPTTSAGGGDDPAWGPEDALVTIEEFSDFQCPYCAKFKTETLHRIRETYGDRVRFIYRDFPLTSIHQFALKAAEAAQCAHDQGRFWEYHDLLFANQDALTPSDLMRYAEEISADTSEFSDCLDSGKNAQEVALDLQDGFRAGVTGTPAFLINGLLLSGAQPFKQFQAVIDQALAAAGE